MARRLRKTLAALLALAILFVTGAYAVDNETSEIIVSPTFGQSEARAMLDMVNAFRTGDEAFYWNETNTETVSAVGEPLSYSYALEEIAMQRAAEIALSFSHTRPDGTSCFSASASDGTTSWGENIAAGSSTASGAFMQWREDNDDYAGQGHRRNMLNPNYSAIGIGHVALNGTHYWAQEFGYETDSAPETAAVDTERDVTVTVSPARIQSVELAVSESELALQVGESAALPTVSASVKLAEAWPNRATTVGVNAVWTSGDASICDTDGHSVSGVAAGSAVLTGAALGKTVAVSVTVGGGGDPAPDNGVYAILYEDGTLVFQNGAAPESGRAVMKTYEVDLTAVYSYTPAVHSPWYHDKQSIRAVSFADKISPTSTAFWFNEFPNLERIDNIENLDTSNVTDMSGMFYRCIALKELDASRFDTAKVTNMWGMFSGCTGLKELDVSRFDTANVTAMNHMFFQCAGLTALDVSAWNTANVTDMNHMFFQCAGLTALDVSAWNTANVTDMKQMFAICSGLTALDVSGFDTANVTNMERMFVNCAGLTALDTSSFDTANVTDMSWMFSSCSNLKTVWASEKFTTAFVTESGDMFSGCTSLVGGAGTPCDNTHRDAEYARIDNPPSAPGYFTDKNAPVSYRITAAVPSADAGTLSVTLTNPGGATVAVSYFDASSRFVSAQLQDVGANAGTVTLALSADAVTARVMLLDGDFRPLCPRFDASIG